MGLSHHVVVLDYGEKVGDGTPEEVRRNPDVVAAYLGVKH
jgi:branched-chain amino acid transport system ATP-binding protein